MCVLKAANFSTKRAIISINLGVTFIYISLKRKIKLNARLRSHTIIIHPALKLFFSLFQLKTQTRD